MKQELFFIKQSDWYVVVVSVRVVKLICLFIRIIKKNISRLAYLELKPATLDFSTFQLLRVYAAWFGLAVAIPTLFGILT